MMVEHNRVVPMIKQIDPIMDALLDHDSDRGTPVIQAFQRVVGFLGYPGFLVGLCWVRWVRLTLEPGGLGWVGNVPNPGYLANPMKVLPYDCDPGVSLILKVK